MRTSKRIKIFHEENAEGKSIIMENVYLTFDCGYKVNPHVFINHDQGIVSIATGVKCENCNCNMKSLTIGNHVIKNVIQVFSLPTFTSYLSDL